MGIAWGVFASRLIDRLSLTGLRWRGRDGWIIAASLLVHQSGFKEEAMPNRREFLRNAAGASAGMLLLGGGVDSVAEPSPQTGPGPKRREVGVGKGRLTTVEWT